VIAHGRFSGHGRPKSWVAADIVLQDEATAVESKSGLPMIGRTFPSDPSTKKETE
jgi:hypothetical protein